MVREGDIWQRAGPGWSMQAAAGPSKPRPANRAKLQQIADHCSRPLNSTAARQGSRCTAVPRRRAEAKQRTTECQHPPNRRPAQHPPNVLQLIVDGVHIVDGWPLRRLCAALLAALAILPLLVRTGRAGGAAAATRRPLPLQLQGRRQLLQWDGSDNVTLLVVRRRPPGPARHMLVGRRWRSAPPRRAPPPRCCSPPPRCCKPPA